MNDFRAMKMREHPRSPSLPGVQGGEGEIRIGQWFTAVPSGCLARRFP